MEKENAFKKQKIFLEQNQSVFDFFVFLIFQKTN